MQYCKLPFPVLQVKDRAELCWAVGYYVLSAMVWTRRDSSGGPLTDDDAKLWFGTISVGTPPVSFTGMKFLYDDSKPLTANDPLA